jgi:hypothetical protein
MLIDVGSREMKSNDSHPIDHGNVGADSCQAVHHGVGSSSQFIPRSGARCVENIAQAVLTLEKNITNVCYIKSCSNFLLRRTLVPGNSVFAICQIQCVLDVRWLA